MIDSYSRIGPIIAITLIVFIGHLIIMAIAGYFIYDYWFSVPGKVIDGAGFVPYLVLIPLGVSAGITLVSAADDDAGRPNGAGFVCGILVGTVYTLGAYVIQIGATEDFFRPAIVLLPMLYSLVYIVTFALMRIVEG